MKLNQRLVLLCGLFLGLLTSCADEQEELRTSGGTFSVATISVNSEAIQSGVRSRTGEGDNVPSGQESPVQPEHYKNGFYMSVSNYGTVIYDWNSYDAVFNPESGETEHRLRAGSYDAAVRLGNPEVEGFGEPAFHGEKTFTVVNDMNTRLNVLCTLSNAKFRVEYTERFKGYFSNYTTHIISSLQKDFDISETQNGALYLKPGTVTASLKARKSGGSEGKYAIGEYVLKAQHEYVLTLDVDVYSKQMTISFSDQVAEENLTIDVSDAALNAQAPVMLAKGFENGGLVELVEGDTPSSKVQVHINAQANVKQLIMKMESESSLQPIWNNQYDLAQPLAKEIMDMGLELHGLGDEASQMSMVDLTRFLSNVPKDQSVKFTFSVVDRFNKMSDNDVILNVLTSDAGFTVEMPEQTAKFCGNECKVKVSFKKGHFETMKFKVAGTDHNLNISNIETLEPSEGLEHYTLTLVGDENLKFVEPFQINVQYLGYNLNTAGTCNVGPGILLDNEADAWATKAVLHVYYDDMFDLTAQKLVGQEWITLPSKVNGTDLIVTGLEPNTTQSLRVVKANITPTNIVEVTTEPMLQVPNAGMEDWYNDPQWKFWEVSYLGVKGQPHVWDTMNLLTTSANGNFRYQSNSGTIKTTGKNGSAALIRAVGWGGNNTAVGKANSAYGTVGELYLGSYNQSTQQANYSGIEFAARPLKMTFDYKYAPGKGGDSYYAEIIVMNGNEEIGRGIKRDANAVGDWTAGTVVINYTQPSKKATHLCIKFKSGDKDSNDSFVTVPAFGNLSDGEFVGSQLYIDNINLIYE